MDVHNQGQRRKNMQAVKSRNTKIEQILGRAMWAKGYRYRKNDPLIIGRPDFTFRKMKVAIFCDSEFFHGKDWSIKKFSIKTNTNFWIRKIEKNIERDKIVNNTLLENGWYVLRFWGDDIKKNPELCVRRVTDILEERKLCCNTSNSKKDSKLIR